jgi:two-component sensor histidine kinase
VIEVAVGVGLTVLLALARMALLPWAGDAAPYAFVFTAVVGAAVLAGWRSGLIALILGQSLVWIFVLEPYGSITPKHPIQVGGLVIATLSQLVVLAIITLYQREVEWAWSKRENQIGLIEKALAEIDHRTTNNYQTVLALILAQAKSATDEAVREALQQVADRIRAIASASQKLAVASEGLEQVRISEHLQDLCDEIEKGLSRSGLSLHCELQDIVLNADDTVCVSILVNELVTNALKHAFPDDRTGTIRIALASAGADIELSVADNGVGIARSADSRGTGLGQRLIDTFVKQLRARHEVETGPDGTVHRIRFRKAVAD